MFLPQEQLIRLVIEICSPNDGLLHHLLGFIRERLHGFHKTVEELGVYRLFLPLFHDSSEAVRVRAVEILLELFRVIDSPVSLRDIFCAAMAIFNPKNNTLRVWGVVEAAFFSNADIQSHLFPFICFLAHNQDRAIVEDFVERIKQTLQTVDDGLSSSLLRCPFWYFWLFFLCLQCHPPEAIPPTGHTRLVKICAKLCTKLLAAGKKPTFKKSSVVGASSALQIAGILCRSLESCSRKSSSIPSQRPRHFEEPRPRSPYFYVLSIER
jgi:hypothetical protein